MNIQWTVVYVANDDVNCIECLGIFTNKERAREYIKNDIECNKDQLVEDGIYHSKKDIPVVKENEDCYVIENYGRWIVTEIIDLDFK